MSRLRVQIGGTLAAESNWSNTLEFLLSGDVPNLTVLQTIANTIRSNLVASTPFKSALCTDTTLVNVKCLFYPGTATVATLVAQGGGAAQAGTAAPVHAPQVAVVASLRTGAAGRSARGRLYVPYRGSNISAAGVVQNSGLVLVSGYASAVVQAVGGALVASSLSGAWVVYSPKLNSVAAVSSILVGSQCDTVRHRNDNRAETYTSYPVPAVTADVPDEEGVEFVNGIANAPIFSPNIIKGAEVALPIVIGAAIGE